MEGRAAQQHGAGVRPVNAENEIAQRRFSGAVLAQQSMHLAALDSKRYVIERGEGAELLGEMRQFEKRHASPPLP
jgi:hypothetical protein